MWQAATGKTNDWAGTVLTLDQLWLSKDLIALNASGYATLRSDHLRMNFRVRRK